ncbi:hypothetical protein [Streptomyces sp. NPDC050145]|uniref:hypothetical protein n=1 Tax=Streptomyces sp. NPDC050145 TaxID=3365602 RepID=UPI00379CF7B7
MFPNAGQNGQWVRTRTETDAKAYMKEYEERQEREREGPGRVTVGLAALACLFFVGWAVYALLR